MNTLENFTLAQQAIHFLSSIRRDILANLSSYEERFAAGQSAEDILAVAHADAAQYARLAGAVRNKATSALDKLTAGLAGIGVTVADANAWLVDIEQAAAAQAGTTSLSQLNTVAAAIRATILPDERVF